MLVITRHDEREKRDEGEGEHRKREGICRWATGDGERIGSQAVRLNP